MRIVLLVDWEACRYRAGEKFVTLPGSEQDFVFKGLSAPDRNVTVIPFGPDLRLTCARLCASRPQAVFNLAASFCGDRRSGQFAAALLEMLRLPYTGSAFATLMLCLDKALSKWAAREAQVATPRFMTVQRTGMPRIGDLPFPLLVKPRFGEGSELLCKRSLVTTPQRLWQRIAEIRRSSDAPLMCEEFIEGRDLFVPVLGNRRLLVLPAKEFVYPTDSSEAPRFETYRVKHNAQYRKRWSMSYPRAKLTGLQQRQIERISKRLYRALGLRDYARFDFRLAPDNTLYFLEANTHPDLSPNSFGMMCSWAGIKYEDVLTRIVRMALGRRAASRATATGHVSPANDSLGVWL
jgi:D-alanine-D-alanine ligase